MDAYLTANELAEMTEYQFVKDRPAATLGLAVSRAHLISRDYGPFPAIADLADDEDRQAQFVSDMQTALFLVAEGIVLSSPARPMEAAGITQQRLAQVNVSRAEGGGRSGTKQTPAIVTPEVLGIFRYWNTTSTTLMRPNRTDVFEPTHHVDAGDTDRRILVREDIDNLSIEEFPGTFPSDPLLNPDQ